MSVVDVGAIVSRAAGAVSELGRRSGDGAVGADSRRIRSRIVLIEVDNQVVRFREGYLNIPAKTDVNGQFGRQLDVIHHVGRNIPVAQLLFLGIGAVFFESGSPSRKLAKELP